MGCNNKVTEKQQNFIKLICHTLDIEFKGVTKADATEFIDKNIAKFKQQQYMCNALYQILHEEHGFSD